MFIEVLHRINVFSKRLPNPPEAYWKHTGHDLEATGRDANVKKRKSLMLRQMHRIMLVAELSFVARNVENSHYRRPSITSKTRLSARPTS